MKRQSALHRIIGSCVLVLQLGTTRIALADSDVVRASAREEIVSVVLAAPGRRSKLPTSVVLEVFAETLESKTSLRLRSPEQAGVDSSAFFRCPAETRFSCWADLARQSGSEPARYLLVLSLHPKTDSTEIVSSAMISLAGSFASEADVLEATVTSTPTEVSIEDASGLRRVAKRWMEQTFMPMLAANDHVATLGGVELHVEQGPVLVLVDGRVLGRSAANVVQVRDLSLGAHRVGVTWSDGRQTAVDLIVAAGEPAHVELAPRAPSTSPRPLVAGMGAGTIGLGVAALVAAQLGAADGVTLGCAPSAGGECPGSVVVRSGYSSPPPVGATLDAVNNSGVPLVPLGVSLIVGGTTWLLGSLFWGEHEDFPWEALLVGAGLGAGSYAIAAVAVE